MERGPLTLFGAIVAVGIGPALWLGAQLGSMDLSPSRPPAISSVVQPVSTSGGAGAADEPATRTVATTPPRPAREPVRRPETVADRRDDRPPAPATPVTPPESGTPPVTPSEPVTPSATPDEEATTTPPTPGVTPSETPPAPRDTESAPPPE